MAKQKPSFRSQKTQEFPSEGDEIYAEIGRAKMRKGKVSVSEFGEASEKVEKRRELEKWR